jgi:hypothetical protein
MKSFKIMDCSAKSHKVWQVAIMADLGYTYGTAPKEVQAKLLIAQSKLGDKSIKTVTIMGKYQITKGW